MHLPTENLASFWDQEINRKVPTRCFMVILNALIMSHNISSVILESGDHLHLLAWLYTEENFLLDYNLLAMLIIWLNILLVLQACLMWHVWVHSISNFDLVYFYWNWANIPVWIFSPTSFFWGRKEVTPDLSPAPKYCFKGQMELMKAVQEVLLVGVCKGEKFSWIQTKTFLNLLKSELVSNFFFFTD